MEEFLHVMKGKRIKLTLKSSSYIGVIQRINSNKSLVLDHVSGSNGCRLPGSRLFFGHEIRNVEFASAANTDSANTQDNRQTEHVNVEKFQPYSKTLRLCNDEEERIDFVVIDHFHEKFGPAMMDIREQRVVGVGADGVEVFKHGRLCWLQIATKKKVYLFDILSLGTQAFRNGLSMILESKRILKIIHDCRAIAGCLISQFGVKLTHVFDTQVADVMCFYSETGGFLPNRVSTLEEVVSLHLKVSSSQLLPLQIKSKLVEEERAIWQKRPCPAPLFEVMAQAVIHLHPLRLVLMDTLMSDYTALVDSYLNSSHFEPDDLDYISMESVLELPRELRKLEQIHRERQESAGDHYPITEQGLLARFNPKIQPPTQTSLLEEQHSRSQTDSFEPATMDTHSSADVNLPVLNPPTSPQRVNTFSSPDVRAYPDSPAQAPVPAAIPDLRKDVSDNSLPGPLGTGRGCTQGLMDIVGRGRPFGKQLSSIPALPAKGRGFLLQMSQAQIPRESSWEVECPDRVETAPSWSNQTPSKEVMPQLRATVNGLPKDGGVRGDSFTPTLQSPSSALWQSFRSFRY